MKDTYIVAFVGLPAFCYHSEGVVSGPFRLRLWRNRDMGVTVVHAYRGLDGDSGVFFRSGRSCGQYF